MNTQDKQQRKHKRPWRRITAAVILLLMSAVLMILSARVPDFAEWYSEYIYPLAVNTIGRVSGMVPFPVSETGIYLPFTVEANYNGDMPAYDKPFTVCHELSHLRGFMEEQEANFIAFLACIGSERADFQYSGYLSGWVYCMNALYRADYESWQEVRGTLAAAAEPDLTANNEFWDRHEGTISETAERINDTYLTANGQTDGVQSYNRMVDLIVAYYGDDI